MTPDGNPLLRGARCGDARLALALTGRPEGAATAALGWLLVVGLISVSCQSQPEASPHEALSYHAKFKPGMPLAPILELCGGPICALKGSTFQEVEYVSDSSANIKGYVLRTAAPTPPNVQKSQELFASTRQAMIVLLGSGESFLQSGDPTYWPTRDKEARVVTLTSEDDQHTVVAVGAVGPDAEKIPPDGVANDPAQVAAYWDKLTGLPDPAASGKR